MKKISRAHLRMLIEQQYKGVPAKFADDHKKQMGQRMRSNSEMMDLLKQGDIGFGERGMKYDPVVGDDGRPVGVSQRDRSGQEMKSVRDAADIEAQQRAAAEGEKRQAREAKEARLASLSLPEITDERNALFGELDLFDENTRRPYGARGDIDSRKLYRKRDGSPFTKEELQLCQDYDTLEARQHGSYAALAGYTSTTLSPDSMVLTVRYRKYTSG